MKHLVFIVNPFSGTSDKSDFLNKINQNLDLSKFTFEVVYTTHPGHAHEIASKYKGDDKVYALIAVGGDGTVNEVASALLHSDICLGVIPAGSGNGFASHIGMQRNVAKSLKILNTAREELIDTGMYNDERTFVNIAGIGFDAKIVHHSKLDKMRGFLNYFNTTIKLTPGYKPIVAEIETDQGIYRGEYASIVIANATTYGYNFKIAPKASFVDGVFDIVLIKNAPVYKYFLYSPLYFTKGAENLAFLDHITTKHIRVKTTEDSYYHLDGEGIKGKTEYNFDIVPRSLKVLTNK